MENKKLTEKIIGCAIKVHKALEPGLLESAYQECLFYELHKQGLKVKKEVSMPLVYDDVKLECGYRLDLFVEDEVILELKSVDQLNDIHLAQLLTYLKLADKRTGLLINFNVIQLIHGVKRVVNGY